MSNLVGNPKDQFSCFVAHFEPWQVVPSIVYSLLWLIDIIYVYCSQ